MSDSEDLLAVVERNTRTKTSWERIPFDIIVEIFARLPARSVARFRSVCKQWASIPILPYFEELFLTRSSARPKLLFACNVDGQVLFFSSPQPRILGEDSLSLLAATYQMKIPYDFKFERFTPIRGLVFLRDGRVIKGNKRQAVKINKHQVPVVCNPGTGQYLTLPKVNTRRRIGVRSYFGYDPVENQYKVLSMTWLGFQQYRASEEHQVLKFGSDREPSWKRIECSIPHSPHYACSSHICINGVLYYRAFNPVSMAYIIVCFDVGTLWTRGFGSDGSFRIDGNATRFTLRVLEDAEKDEWSEHIYLLDDIWKNVVGDKSLSFAGVTRTNEIVFCPCYQYQYVPFCVFYYNTERKTITRVEIQGMEACEGGVYTFMDHVEDVSLMDVF